MTDPSPGPSPVSVAAGRWAVCLVAGSIVIVLVASGTFLRLPISRQLGLAGYLWAYAAALVLAVIAVIVGIFSVARAKPFPKSRPGRAESILLGWVAVWTGFPLGVYYAIMLLVGAVLGLVTPR